MLLKFYIAGHHMFDNNVRERVSVRLHFFMFVIIED